MATYLGQLNNRVEINKRKLLSLEEYKNTLLGSKDNIDPSLLEDRLEQIDIEFARLKKTIHANRKAEAHYKAAYNHLLDLRGLDNKLQLATEPSEKEKIEQEILEHTSKLQRHLSILPEKLVAELQEEYTKYAENNPLILEEVAATIEQSTQDSEEGSVYQKLLEIFEAEQREFSEIKEFASKEEFEKFLNKYTEMKLNCYQQPSADTKVADETLIPEIHKDEPEKEEMNPTQAMGMLIEGLEIDKAPHKKLHPTNANIAESFKEELKTGNWLYNVIHFKSELVAVPEISKEQFMNTINATERNKARVSLLKERISSLSKTSLKNIYEEYYSEKSNSVLPTALSILISDNLD